MSVPNQKTIIIHQTTQIPFVMIGLQEYKDAFRKMAPATFAMYLYLAGNMEGFKLELSQAAFENATGYGKSSYHRAYKELVALGYIYKDNCGSLNFATSPHESYEIKVQDWEEEVARMEPLEIRNGTDESQNCNEAKSEMNREKNKIDKLNNSKEDRDSKKASPSSPSSLDYLKTIIAPNGEYIGGEKKGQWLEDEVPNLWGLSRLGRITAICNNTDFSEDDAHMISYSILEWRNRKYKTIRPIDFEKDIFFIGE